MDGEVYYEVVGLFAKRVRGVSLGFGSDGKGGVKSGRREVEWNNNIPYATPTPSKEKPK